MEHKLLLSSVCRPFGGPGEGDSVGAELFHAQVTRAQGAFSLRQVIRVWALDYLAENLQTPTVALHYPSKSEFIRELKRGHYSHVGINFVVSTFHKAREMVKLVRKYSPRSVIVLGGYGTVLPDEVLRPYGDAICREEGIVFMRKLLGEPLDVPIMAPHAPNPATKVIGVQQRSAVGHVTSGLGCPNGCDFCCTSHFFDRAYIPFMKSGEEIYSALRDTRRRAEEDGVNMESFIVIDEDFFLHHRRAKEFLECVRDSGEYFPLMGFGSVKGLSRFTETEIAEMGFEVIWNAFEGEKAGYQKQQGKSIKQLYKELQSVGTAQLCSMIIGFPYQDDKIIKAEFDELMKLGPAMVQILIYFAFPGTPFHEEVIAKDRYNEQYRTRPDLRRWDGFAMHYNHPKFDDPSEIERIQKRLYRADFERLGPSPLRLGAVWLKGYANLKDTKNTLLAQRAEGLRKRARSVLPLTAAVAKYGPSMAARAKARALHKEIVRHTGPETTVEKLMARATPTLYLLATALERMNLLQQPGLLRTTHRMGDVKDGRGTRDAFRLQGGIFSGIGTALSDDIGEHALRLIEKAAPALSRIERLRGDFDFIASNFTRMQPSVVPGE